eukprot:256479-Rhodomonas_salina.1
MVFQIRIPDDEVCLEILKQAEIERAGGVGKAKEKSEREKAARQWVGMLLGLPDELFFFELLTLVGRGAETLAVGCCCTPRVRVALGSEPSVLMLGCGCRVGVGSSSRSRCSARACRRTAPNSASPQPTKSSRRRSQSLSPSFSLPLSPPTSRPPYLPTDRPTDLL